MGVCFVPLLERHRIVQLSLQPTAESCRTPEANVKGAAFHLLADPAAFLFYSSASGKLKNTPTTIILHVRF